MDNVVKVLKIDNLNTLVIRQLGEQSFFTTTKDSIIISVPHLAVLLKYLLVRGYLNKKIIEGVLEEYNSLEGFR